MAENPRAPATLRITRPYGSENDFVEGDFAWIGRTSIVLPNGPARPTGELIRFEVVLSSGAAVFRGEGHVVAHYPPGSGKPPGLEVRFTRIDARSKLLLDRVRARRMTLAQTADTTHLTEPHGSGSAEPSEALPVLKPPVDRLSDLSGVHIAQARVHGKIAPPPNRDDILARLRLRAQRVAESGMSFKKRQSSG